MNLEGAPATVQHVTLLGRNGSGISHVFLFLVHDKAVRAQILQYKWNINGTNYTV